MNFEERLEHVMQELSHTKWDLLIFTETWRQENDEIIKQNKITIGLAVAVLEDKTALEFYFTENTLTTNLYAFLIVLRS